MSGSRTPAQEASDYFDALPIEQRLKLAPLLEDCRRRGLLEAQAAMCDLSRQIAARGRAIEAQAWR